MTGRLSQRRRMSEAEQAEDYAQIIRSADWIQPDWQALNARIIDEFGLAGLARIKRRAWRMIEGEPRR
jgi:hypothetical protein